MAHIHREPYITLAGLTDERALISWGAFFFDVNGEAVDGRFKLIEDKSLRFTNPPRESSIGESSSDYGPAEVWVWEKGSDLGQAIKTEVPSESPATRVNHVWVENLKPNTTYHYRVVVKDEPWAEEERRDWVTLENKQGMFLNKGQYQNEFTTYARATDKTPNFTFAVIGDYGKGMKKKDSPQQKIAEALAEAIRTKDVRFVLTTGDHIYGQGFFSGNTGNEDSDWFFTHYQPYRYILNRVPFYPTCGNHDADETEKSDDYTQMLDNFYIRERFFSGNRDEGDAVKEHGLFYQFKYGSDVEFISIDSAKPKDGGDRAFMLPNNQPFLNQVMPPIAGPPTSWRIPFFHHPPYVDGPTKKNSKDAEKHLVKPLFEKAGVRLVFNGHEHNFQISAHNNIHYVLTGAAGDLREGKLRGQAKAHNIAWAAKYHFLLVEYQGGKMRITPYGELREGKLQALTEVKKPGGQSFPLPLEISLT